MPRCYTQSSHYRFPGRRMNLSDIDSLSTEGSLYERTLLDFISRSQDLAAQIRAESLYGDFDEIRHITQICKNIARLAGADAVYDNCLEILRACDTEDLHTILSLTDTLQRTTQEAVSIACCQLAKTRSRPTLPNEKSLSR